MVLPHNLQAPVSVTKPEPVGVCDRCDFMWYLRDLTWQFQWSARKLINLHILVCPRCLDTPAPFLQTFRFGPEPQPLPNARPTQYAAQNQGGTAPITSVEQILDE